MMISFSQWRRIQIKNILGEWGVVPLKTKTAIESTDAYGLTFAKDHLPR